MQDVADLLSRSPLRSSVCESKASNAEFLGMSWEYPRPPDGLCQLRREAGWQ